MPVKYGFYRHPKSDLFRLSRRCFVRGILSFELWISDLSGSSDGQIFVDFVLTDVGSVHIPFDLFVFYELIKNMLTHGLFH